MVNKIYVLRLENDKFYIGRTKNIFGRLDEHKNLNGSYWTIQNKPIDLVEVFETEDIGAEEKTVVRYMQKYGINNVRGASFARPTLSDDEKSVIDKMFRSDYIKVIDHLSENGLESIRTGHFSKLNLPKGELLVLRGSFSVLATSVSDVVVITSLEIARRDDTK